MCNVAHVYVGVTHSEIKIGHILIYILYDL